MRSFPKGFPLEGFNEWAKTYDMEANSDFIIMNKLLMRFYSGDIVYAPVPGMDIVILNSQEIAQEFLAKRPTSTAGRRFSYLLTHLMGWEWEMPLLQPGPHHSNQRKMLHRAIGTQRVGSHDPRIESEVAKLVAVLSTFQGTPITVVQEYIGRMVSKAVYGELIRNGFSLFLVDVLHFLRFIPNWFSGLCFKEGNDLSRKIRCIAYRRSVELFKSGIMDHSILNDLLDEFRESEETQDATSMLYLAASDTTSAGAIQFLHVLFLFPEVAQRVYVEIQSVTQGLRLPQITDRPQLPYTEAVWKEAVRWRTFFPLGLPHVNLEDEIVRGYFIPKGTVIHQNTRMMVNDPNIWGDPEVFRPERFLEPDAAQRPNPFTPLFGWGVRVCPGLYFADRVVLHLVVTVASLYRLEPLEGIRYLTWRLSNIGTQ
ncbi:cytochrome P450 [Serendipita vermifera]|nr:cytochrome P450 [Serendipita vermifera]